jgi:hypothetical protein
MNDEVWIPASRLRPTIGGLIALAAAAFSAFATLVLDRSTNPYDRPIGWALFTVFALAAVAGLWVGAGPGRRGLLLSADGFSIHGVLSPRRFRWGEVRDFKVLKIRSNTFVGFDMTYQVKTGLLQRTGQTTIGADHLLPNTLRMEPARLAALMESHRRQHSAG